MADFFNQFLVPNLESIILAKVNVPKFCLFFATFVTLFLLAHNIKSTVNNCFNAHDFGINLQAINNASRGELNPTISIHSLTLFQDHFVPALFLAVPGMWLTNSAYFPLFFEWFMVTAFIFFLLATSLKNTSNKTEILLITVCLLFNKGLPMALNFPLHPDTWSAPIWALLIRAVYNKKNSGVIFYAICLYFFKETFSCAIIGLSFFYCLKREFKIAAILFFSSLLMLYFNFKIRPAIFGDLYPYSSDIFFSADESIIGGLIHRWNRIQKDIPIKLYYPFLLPLLAMTYKKETFWNLLAGLSLASPLLAILFLYNNFYQHHAAPITAIFVATAVLGGAFRNILLIEEKFIAQKYKRFAPLCLLSALLFIASSSSVYSKYLRHYLGNDFARCKVVDRSESNTLLFKNLNEMHPGDALIATGGIIPLIIPKIPYGVLLHHFHGFNKVIDKYDYILVEKNGLGDINPLVLDDIPKLMELCQKEVTQVIMDDNAYFLAKGNFSKSCSKWPKQ